MVKYLFNYSPETGELTWRIKRGTAKIGGSVGNSWAPDGGYKNCRILINNKAIHMKVHRIIWLWWYGYLPENQIDHIDRDPSNNRLKNLREVSRQCNVRNSGVYSTNRSGVKGVGWNKQIKKWIVRISVMDDSKYLEYHTDLTEAVCHRYAAEQCLDWHHCDADSSAYQYLKAQGVIK